MAEAINPKSLGVPSGFSHGMLLPAGRILFIAGQVGFDETNTLVSPELPAQFGRAMANVVEVVRAAGGRPDQIGALTIFVTDKQAYLEKAREVGLAYRAVMGKHFPAMALVEVADLLPTGALVEIQGTAVIP